MHLLTFDLTTPNHIFSRIAEGPCTKFEHFGIIRFWVMLQTDKQTNKQSEANFLPTRTNFVGLGN